MFPNCGSNFFKLNLLTFFLSHYFQPGVEPGDIVIILQQKEHEFFTRQGSDLHCVHSIGIAEALCGFDFTIKHLDGRDLLIRNPPGSVISPGIREVFAFN